METPILRCTRRAKENQWYFGMKAHVGVNSKDRALGVLDGGFGSNCAFSFTARFRFPALDLNSIKSFAAENPFQRLAGGRVIVLPDVFEGFGEGLQFDGAVDMAGVPGEDELVVVVLCGEGFGHVFVGDDPVVHVVAHDVGVEEVAVADFHPDADRLARACCGMRCSWNSQAPCGVSGSEGHCWLTKVPE